MDYAGHLISLNLNHSTHLEKMDAECFLLLMEASAWIHFFCGVSNNKPFFSF